MKKLYSLFLIVLCCSGFSQIIVSDNFTYPDGSLVGNGGWINHSGTNGDLMVVSGQALVQHGTPSEDANLPFTAVTGDVYFGIDIMIEDLGAAISGTDSEYFMHFMEGTSNFRARVDIVPPSGSGDFSVGITTLNGSADATWATDLSFDTTYRITVRYNQDDNISELWVNAGAESDTSILGNDEMDPGISANAFGFRQSDSTNNEGILVDNLIIAETFDDTLLNTACGVTFGVATYNCDSNTDGDNNDGVTINIPYSGMNAGITSVTTSSAGTVAGDSPITMANGTITITGLSEGDAWDVVLNGGDCDGVSVSGTVPADQCNPAPTVCFNLTDGSNLFLIETVTTNTDMDEWVFDSGAGTYTMNGFCGSGCAENVETWLVFGELDTTSATGLMFGFTGSESFGTTDLDVMYTTNFTGVSTSSWTSLATITDGGVQELDLSSISSTSLVLAIRYIDDGADGYSGWTLSDVNIFTNSTGTCATLDLLAVNNFSVNLVDIKVYLNATKELEVNGAEVAAIQVYDLNGRVVAKSNAERVSVVDLDEGVYIASIQDNNGNTFTKKFIKR